MTEFNMENELFNLHESIQSIHKYFGYEMNWCEYPIMDHTEYYWTVEGDYTVHFSETKLEKVEDGFDDVGAEYSCDIIHDVRLEKDKYTMINIDTRCDGNKYLAIFDNSKKHNHAELMGKNNKNYDGSVS
jgi:hypothetical protein